MSDPAVAVAVPDATPPHPLVAAGSFENVPAAATTAVLPDVSVTVV